MCYGIGVGQYVINEERYEGLESLVSTKKICFGAPVKEKDVIKDETEAGVDGCLDGLAKL